MPLPFSRDRQRQFWSQIRAGESLRDASALSAIPFGTCRIWFRDAGGMPPISLAPPAAGRFLTIADREAIASGMDRELSIRSIARGIGKQPSTVLREIRANMFHQKYRSRGRVDGTAPGRPPTHWRYSPHLAQKRADQNASRPKVAKLAANERLRKEVESRLKKKASPEQIANRLR